MNSEAITTSTTSPAVLLCGELESDSLESLLQRYGLELHRLKAGETIPGSFWQAPEAGLIENRVYVRTDTPLHSALHETCHYICMDETRRHQLHTNAGGGYEEEDGVCYLQILLTEQIDEMTPSRMFSDMDAWGYSFRLGSVQAWFERDAEDARQWLITHAIIDELDTPSFKLRQD
jgi:hypothetical protein